MGAHAANNAHAGGMHFGRMGAHVGGAHASMGGDGIVPAVAGGVMLEVLKKGIEEKWDFDHWASGFAGAGFSGSDIDKAKRAAWANAGANPNASAIDGMKNILELNKATGNLGESIDLLPLFSRAEMAMQSVKAEGLHSKFTGGTQILNLAKGLEEMGVTTKGDTPEERQANVEKYTNELIRTMVASRGLFDGNKLFAMTNNSGGAAQNWDMRFGTTIAPIIGDIMNHSKLGNADYMSLKSFQGGHITSDAVSALVKYHLAKTGEGGDAYQDTKGNWHLKANSEFAKGMDSNLFDWSGGVLEKLKAAGYDINDQKFMNGVVNEIGSNKSNSMLMRAVLEPGTRKQIQKEIDLRDKVPNDVAGVLQNSDPVLKLDAMHKKLEDFYTALGEGVAGPAIAGLTKLTAGINALSQAMEAHPDITKYAAGAAGIGGLSLFGYGAGKMLGLIPGGDAGLGVAATKLDAAADHLMLVGGGTPSTLLKDAEKLAPGALPALGAGALAGVGAGMLAAGGAAGAMKMPMVDEYGRVIGNWGGAAPAASGGPAHPDDDRATRARASEVEVWRQQQDMIKSVGQQFGALNTHTGFVLTSFDTLKSGGAALNDNFHGLSAGSGGLDNAFRIVRGDGHGRRPRARHGRHVGRCGRRLRLHERQLRRRRRFGGGGGSPDLSAAFRGGAGAGIGHLFSAADREKNIRTYAASIGINPDVAMAVARSEGFGQFSGDHGTSFGDLQMHIGGGLGDFYRRATGKNPADPHNELELDRYALDQAKRGGWAPWHGAAAKHIYGRYGIGLPGAHRRRRTSDCRWPAHGGTRQAGRRHLGDANGRASPPHLHGWGKDRSSGDQAPGS